MNFTDIGNVIVDLDKILWVDKGKWNNTKQDHEAILVMEGGVRCETGAHIQEVRAIIQPDAHQIL